MTIEGLGEKFRTARLARKLTLDEAARITKIRPSRLAEIEEDDFSNFPSLAYEASAHCHPRFQKQDVSAAASHRHRRSRGWIFTDKIDPRYFAHFAGAKERHGVAFADRNDRFRSDRCSARAAG
jgi:hypothetical protein